MKKDTDYMEKTDSYQVLTENSMPRIWINLKDSEIEVGLLLNFGP